MTAGLLRSAVRVLGCLAVVAGAVAGAGFFGRTLLQVAQSDRRAAPLSAARPGASSRTLPDRRDPAADEPRLRRPDDLLHAPVRPVPADLAVPDGAVAEGLPDGAGAGAEMTALICPLTAAETDQWVRRKMADLGWTRKPDPPAAAGEYRAAFERPDARCWSRIEPRRGGGCRLFYMRVALEDRR